MPYWVHWALRALTSASDGILQVRRHFKIMNLRLISIVAGATLCVAASAQQMPWAKSFSEAKAQAAARHTLVMADFYTDW